MHNLLKNKFILILLIAISLFSFIIKPVEASSENTLFIDGTVYNIILPDNLSGNYVICRNGSAYVLLYTSSGGYYKIIKQESNGLYQIRCYSDEACTSIKNYNIISISSTTTTLDFVNGNIGSWKPTDYEEYYCCTGVFYATTDIYFNGELFFQVPPQTIMKTLVEETTRVQIMEQIKKMIVGFLKYLIVLVISLLAFWKGWQFLSTQLRKA